MLSKCKGSLKKYNIYKVIDVKNQRSKHMTTDKEKLLKTFNIFETTIEDIEGVGEYDDINLKNEIDLIYDNLLNIDMNIHSLLRQRGWDEEI